MICSDVLVLVRVHQDTINKNNLVEVNKVHFDDDDDVCDGGSGLVWTLFRMMQVSHLV